MYGGLAFNTANPHRCCRELVTASRPFSILLIDDDDVAAEAVVRGLRKHECLCPIVLAENGHVALQILRSQHAVRRIEKPYLAFLDLNMPRMNGFEFLHALRADNALRATLVFVLSTSGTDADRARAYEENIAGYMVKAKLGPQLKGLAHFLIEYGSIILLP
jgi:CheY-like chemotaxis protein